MSFENIILASGNRCFFILYRYTMKKIQLQEFSKLIQQEIDVLDTRDTEEFKSGFIPSSINVPLKGLKEWAAVVLKKEAPLLIVVEEGKEAEVLALLQEAGFKNIKGRLDGGFTAWHQAGLAIDMIIDVEPDELMMDIPFDDNLVVVDVRNPIEYAEGHLKDAVNIPMNDISDPVIIAQFSETDNMYLHCGGGTRSVIAASVFKKHGIHNLHNIAGGWKKIKEEPKADIVKEPDVLN